VPATVTARRAAAASIDPAAPAPEAAPLLKDGFAAAAIEGIARRIGAAVPGFDTATFLRHALEGLDGLGLMSRVRQVAVALQETLPAAFPASLPLVERVLGEPPGARVVGEGMPAFHRAPFLEFVALAGLRHPELSLDALARLTRHFTAEFAIRPFLAEHPALSLSRVRQWITHPDARVRRLASEGTRPLLPWGRHIDALKREPAVCLALLGPLAADPDDSVRRSAANHLNDVSRLDPELALAHAAQWAGTGDPLARATVRHALRTLVKKGHPRALAMLGCDVDAPIALDALALSARRVPIGGRLVISASLRSAGAMPVLACVDYAVRYASARGALRCKVFKGVQLTLAAGEVRHLVFTRDFKPRTTRALYPGPHAVELRVNGTLLGECEFELMVPA
jgi:3-methyladenine DNA glycosylase AlkC